MWLGGTELLPISCMTFHSSFQSVESLRHSKVIIHSIFISDIIRIRRFHATQMRHGKLQRYPEIRFMVGRARARTRKMGAIPIEV